MIKILKWICDQVIYSINDEIFDKVLRETEDMNLCDTCAANIEHKCCIREFNIKKGRSKCNNYENMVFLFASDKYEPIDDSTLI